MDDIAGTLVDTLVSADAALEREFATGLAEWSSLAFRVAYSVLRHREDAEDIAQDVLAKAHRNLRQLSSTLDDGRYRLHIVIDDSSLVPGTGAGAPALPTFQSFTSVTSLLLRDGQTAQFVAATDKVSGEVTKIDVTINVLK